MGEMYSAGDARAGSIGQGPNKIIKSLKTVCHFPTIMSVRPISRKVDRKGFVSSHGLSDVKYYSSNYLSIAQ